MPAHLDENSWRSQPTWDLIDNLLDPSADVGFFQALLNERMAMVGAPDILELVAMEAEHSGTPQPQFVEWDPAIAHSRTLPDDDDGIMPLRLRWTERTQMWAASTLLMIPDKHMSNFGYYDTIAEADAAYRALVGLAEDRVTIVRVNREKICRTIVAGQFVPPLGA